MGGRVPRFVVLTWFLLVEKALKESKRLDREMEEREMELEVLQTKLAAALGAMSRIRRLRKVAKKREEALFSRGMAELDEEDGVVSLTSAELRIANDLREWGAGDVLDWSSLGVGEGFADLGPLPQSVTGGIPPGVEGSSADAQ